MEKLVAADIRDAIVTGLFGPLQGGWSDDLGSLPVYAKDDIPARSGPLEALLRDRFATPTDLRRGLEAELPAALHAGLLVLTKVDQEAAQAAARVCLARPRFVLIDKMAVEVLKPHAGDPSNLDVFQNRVAQSPDVAGAHWVTLLEDEAFDKLDEQARQSYLEEHKAANAAVNAFEEANVVRPLVGLLGTNRHQPAFELLLRLQSSHPGGNLRMAAGHALMALGTPAALETMARRLRVRDQSASFFATKAAATLSPATAFDLLMLEEPMSTRAAIEVFRWLDMSASVLDADPRWADFLASFGNNDTLADSAAALLKKFPPKVRKAAIERVAKKAEAQTASKPPIALPPKKELETWLPRYEAGEYEEVWRLLGSLGPEIQNKTVAPIAEAIAEATMLRVRRRVEEIASALKAAGYRFSEKAEPWTAPKKSVGAALKKLEKKVGSLPLSLASFYRHVGSVVLIGGHPDWPKTTVEQLTAGEKMNVYSDALVVWPLDSVLDDAADFGSSGRFPVSVWPDPMGKAGYSAGGCVVYVKDPCADAPVSGDPAGRTFLQYLRNSIAHGGFPGFGDSPPELLRPLCRLANF